MGSKSGAEQVARLPTQKRQLQIGFSEKFTKDRVEGTAQAKFAL